MMKKGGALGALLLWLFWILAGLFCCPDSRQPEKDKARIPLAKIRSFGIAFVMIARAPIAPVALLAPRRAYDRAGSPAGMVFFARADPPEGGGRQPRYTYPQF